MTFALGDIVAQHRAEVAAAPVPERIVIRPRGAVKDFTVRIDGGSYGNIYRILGEKPVRWVQQTDFANEEAVGYLADRLDKLGVDDAL
jgi:GTP-binding protein